MKFRSYVVPSFKPCLLARLVFLTAQAISDICTSSSKCYRNMEAFTNRKKIFPGLVVPTTKSCRTMAVTAVWLGKAYVFGEDSIICRDFCTAQAILNTFSSVGQRLRSVGARHFDRNMIK